MYKSSLIILATIIVLSCKKTTTQPNATVIVHGGAGYVSTDLMLPGDEEGIRKTIEKSLQISHQHLANGGSSVEAVRIAINILEDSPYFNAGKGSVFTSSGTNELDASIMNGQN